MSRERRWIILGEDGRHVSVGRATDPSEAEIEAAVSYRPPDFDLAKHEAYQDVRDDEMARLSRFQDQLVHAIGEEFRARAPQAYGHFLALDRAMADSAGV